MGMNQILIGALGVNIPWIVLLLWQNYRHTRQLLEEKQRSFQAGIKYQKSLVSPKVDRTTTRK